VPAITVVAVETEDGLQSLRLMTDVCVLFQALKTTGLSMMQLIAMVGRLATSAQPYRAKPKTNGGSFEEKSEGRSTCACVERAKLVAVVRSRK